MMMHTSEDAWTNFGEQMQWGGGFTDPCLAEYMDASYDASWYDPAMDPTLCAYAQADEHEGGYESWIGYDGIEDWSRRAPKFPPPNAPAPALVEGMAMLEHAQAQAAFFFAQQNLLGHAASLDLANAKLANQTGNKSKGMIAPPGLEVAPPNSAESSSGLQIGLQPRPKPLGLASMVELASELKEPLHRIGTPATTAPVTPAHSLTESEISSFSATPPGLLKPGAAAGSDSSPTDLGAGYSLFGSAPWLPLQPKTEDARSAPAKVKLEELLCGAHLASKEGVSLAGPPGLFAPPGLEREDSAQNYKVIKRPPGLELATVVDVPEPLLSTTSAASRMSASEEGTTVERVEVDGIVTTRAVWRIVQLRGRLKTSLGKPVVSPAFDIPGLGDVRLMVTPDAKGTLEGMRGKSKQSRFAKMLSEGPLECSLQVKVPCTETPVVKFNLTVGPLCRQGPFTCDFTEHTVHGCNDFQCDWLKQVDDEGNLCVSLEIVEMCTSA